MRALSTRLRPALTLETLASATALLGALAGGFIAHAHERPVTAALAFIFAVVLVATRAGLRAGIAASVLASVVYNLLLSDPFLRFGVRSVDDLVPLLAFNISAVASAYVAGKLKDQARASEAASLRVQSLLTFSQALQTSVSLQEMLAAARRSAAGFEAIELHLDDGEVFSGSDEPSLALLASQLRATSCRLLPTDAGRTVLCERLSNGMVVAITAAEHATDAAAHLAIFAIAAERWTLTQRLVQADVFRRSEEFKTSLLSSVSHDVRTPLAVISASAGSLLRHRESLTAEAQQDLLETIEQQAGRLNQLTGKLLSLGRIEGGLHPSEMSEIDAIDVLGTALFAIRQIAPSRAISKAYSLDYAPVRADPSLLEQVIYNVLENAVVHSPEDTEIHVSVETRSGALVICVDDYGPGVSDAESERIFDRFHQGSRAAKEKRGSGLGLSISRGFARAINGNVTVKCRPDRATGSRFEISLPLEHATNG